MSTQVKAKPEVKTKARTTKAPKAQEPPAAPAPVEVPSAPQPVVEPVLPCTKCEAYRKATLVDAAKWKVKWDNHIKKFHKQPKQPVAESVPAPVPAQ